MFLSFDIFLNLHFISCNSFKRGVSGGSSFGHISFTCKPPNSSFLQPFRQEILKLEARVNALTLEKAKLVEELNDTRKCLLDFNSLKDLLVRILLLLLGASLFN